jgi:hypothetical protein
MAYDAAMKRYSWAKIGFSLIELFLLLVVFPWILKISQADYIPCWQFIFAVWVGFLFANLRSISKLVNIWDYKRVKTIGRLVPVYFPNYLITLVAICLIASYLFFVRWGFPQSVSWYILFCLGFAPDSIWEFITDPVNVGKNMKTLFSIR